MGDPLISVVLPVLNAETDIDICLDSFERQCFREFDICIMDGGSSDGTLEHIKHWKDSSRLSLKIEVELDRGPYEAMNNGVALTSGEWLYFIGADDRLADSRVLSDISDVLLNTDADFVYGDVVLASNSARVCGSVDLDRLLFEGNICHQGIFYRRGVFERLGGYNLRYPIWADWDFNLRCYKTPDIITKWVDRVVAIYNDQGGLSVIEDPVLSKELPATIVRDMRHELFSIRSMRSFRYGKMFFSWLD